MRTPGDSILDLSTIYKRSMRNVIRGREPNKQSLTRSSIFRLLYDFECIGDYLGEPSCRTTQHLQV